MGLPHAEHGKMDARRDLAQEFFAATGAEIHPFVSDEATWMCAEPTSSRAAPAVP